MHENIWPIFLLIQASFVPNAFAYLRTKVHKTKRLLSSVDRGRLNSTIWMRSWCQMVTNVSNCYIQYKYRDSLIADFKNEKNTKNIMDKVPQIVFRSCMKKREIGSFIWSFSIPLFPASWHENKEEDLVNANFFYKAKEGGCTTPPKLRKLRMRLRFRVSTAFIKCDAKISRQ